MPVRLRLPLVALLLIAVIAQAADSDLIALEPSATRAETLVQLDHQGPDGMTLTLTVTGLTSETIVRDGREYQRLDLPDGGFVGAEGQPARPTITRLVALPWGSAAQVRLVSRQDKELGSMNLAPVNPIVGQGDKAASLDLSWYASGTRTEPSVSIGEPALLHGQRVVPVTFEPVGYDPASGAVTAASQMTVEVLFSGRDGRNNPPETARMIPESFATLLEQTVVGWERGPDVEVGLGSVIYVCPNNGTVTNIIEELAEWRRQQGYNVEVVTTNTTGPSNTNIRTYLMSRYAAIEPPLEFVTLVGDANGTVSVPTFFETTSGYGGEGDHDYSRLDGNDVLADVHVGRLTARNTSQLQTIVDKILDYERTPDMSDDRWFTAAGLTGDPSTSGYSCIFTNQFFKQELERLGYARIDTIWGGDFTTQMMNTINQGETFFTYRGLGGMSGMNYSHIEYLSNGRKLPYAIILTCDTGSFSDDTTARSEAFLRAANGGGVASIGTATNGTHTRYNNCMFLGITEHITGSGDFRTGPALTRGKLNFYLNYWQNEQNKVWTWSTWNNLMGDPATEIWTGVPMLLDVDHLDVVATTAGALPITVTSGGVPVPDARVAVYQSGNLRSVGLTDASGRAVLDIVDAASGDIHVTVTGHNLHPYRGTTAVGSVDRSLDVSDINLAGNAQPNDSVECSLQLINGGTNAAGSVTAVLVSNLPWLNVDATPVSFGSITAGGTAWGAETFTMALDPLAPGGVDAVLELQATSGGQTWSSIVTIPVSGARTTTADPTWGLPGGTPDPGESGSVTLALTNVGNQTTAGVTGTLSCDSRWIDVTDPNGSWGSINASGNATQTDPFAIEALDLCYPGHLANFVLTLEFAEGGRQVIEFQTVIGSAGPGDPTGSDAHGYYAFSNDDSSPLAPAFDWYNASLMGTNLGLTDNGRWGDETTLVDLPFTFTYYGRDHDQISVCTNGWLAFGATDLKFYRNWMLPAAGSPDAMVCAFWDDLAQGSVFGYHDEDNHRYIIQWDSFSTWYESYPDGYYDGNCTFQIVLLDPAYHATDTGDGIIVMQYADVTVSNDETTYFTVGIQNHERDTGLTYAYGNNYAGGAATVQSGRAIAFRTVVPQAQGTLQGMVHNESLEGSAVPGAVIKVIGNGRTLTAATNGRFEGPVPEGIWDIAVSHPSCEPDTAFGVIIIEDQTTTVDFSLTDIAGPSFTGTTQVASTSNTVGPYPVEVMVSDITGLDSVHMYYTSSSEGGPFEVALQILDEDLGLMRGEIDGQPLGSRVQYWLTASDVLGLDSTEPVGAPWPCYTFQVDDVTDVVVDEFESNTGWLINALSSDSATAGHWTRVNPVGTEQDGNQVQPEDDHTAASGVTCWVTGQHVNGEGVGYSDVDGGTTSITSPMYDLTGQGAVTVSYWRWFTNDQGNSPNEDAWLAQFSNDGGSTWYDVENTTASNNSWQQVTVDLADHVDHPGQLRIRFTATDLYNGSLVEAAVDDIRILATQITEDTETPSVTLTSPNGGESVSTGQALDVSWQASDDTGVVQARLSLSLDGGSSFGEPFLAGAFNEFCQWTVLVPEAPTNQARLRVEVLDADGHASSDMSNGNFSIATGSTDTPAAGALLALAQNHPNPFNPQTVIAFNLPRDQQATLRIYDVQGRLVRTLVEGQLEAGLHQHTWRGDDADGRTVSSGIYFYRLSTDEGSLVRKMSLLK